mgnify:CR=1 FL=1
MKRIIYAILAALVLIMASCNSPLGKLFAEPTPTPTPTPTLTPTPTPIPGIDKPAVAGIIRLVFIKARFTKVIKEGVTPEDPYDTFIHVKADPRGTTENPPDNTLNHVCPGIRLAFEFEGEKYREKWESCVVDLLPDLGVNFYFPTFENAQNFELVFPDGTKVPLDEIF